MDSKAKLIAPYLGIPVLQLIGDDEPLLRKKKMGLFRRFSKSFRNSKHVRRRNCNSLAQNISIIVGCSVTVI
jgi:hypothetical protein